MFVMGSLVVKARGPGLRRGLLVPVQKIGHREKISSLTPTEPLTPNSSRYTTLVNPPASSSPHMFSMSTL
ncbi:hypothetical protein SRHO_G00008600 [Serrasalmus rhombeus]